MIEPANPNSGDSIPDANSAVLKTFSIDDVAAVAGDMNCFLTSLAAISAFEDIELSLADWLLLATAEREGEVPPDRLARMLGLTLKRINQMVETFLTNQLVSLQPSKNNPRRNAISLTDTGKDRLGQLNSILSATLAPGMAERARYLFVVQRNLKPLLRVFAPRNTAERDSTAAVRPA